MTELADVAIDVVAARYEIASRPVEHRGFKSAWDGLPLEEAAALAWQVTTLTKRELAELLGVSASHTALGNVDRHGVDELVAAVEGRIGYALR